MRKLFFILTLFSTIVFSAIASDVKVAPGTWKTMFSYYSINHIVPSKDYVFAVTDGGVYYLDKEYKEIKILGKEDGLSSGQILNVIFLEKSKTLVLIHSDLTLDFYDIVKEKTIFIDKTISVKDIVGKTFRSVVTTSDEKSIFIGTDFGIIKYNVAKKEVAETYYIGNEGASISITSMTIVGDSLFAYTGNGDIRGADFNNKMLSNYQVWKIVSSPSGTTYSINSHNNHLMALSSKGLFYREGEEWNKLFASQRSSDKMNSYKGHLTYCNEELCRVFREGSFEYDTYTVEQNFAIYDKYSNAVWFNYLGLTSLVDGEETDKYLPSSPFQNMYFRVKKVDDRILLIGNHKWELPAVLSIYEDGEWTNITNESLGTDFDAQKKFYTSVDVVPDPKDKTKYYVPTWRGVFVIKDNKVVERYTHNNSTLVEYAYDTIATLTETSWFDEQGNLFVTNVQAGNLIHVMTPDGKWTSLNHSKFFKKPYATHHLRTKKYGYDVILCEPSNSSMACILFLDTKGTPTNANDDQAVSFNTLTYQDGSISESVIPTRYYSLAEDLKGDVWIGTEQGPFIFKAKTLEKIKDNMNVVVRPKITREEDSRFADYLLSSDNIFGIAVDGANRKWIGTGANGLYLVAEDGTEIIEHFTTENSLLPSNNISSLAYDRKTGNLFVLTDLGLCIYGTDASESKPDYEEITVFPNPVRPEYKGDVAIKGLVENSNVRITDARGNMIENGMSNGGTYIWSARRNDGTRVATGIYNIFVTTQDGTLYEHKKVAVVK